ncbi:MAG: DNA translocase FtsK 4TM domain-containing protein [Bacteroidaceae bacterium]|nr:DNA translocase FtsK 4TM domain-containing protein [Bacteroidaceae bacterium]
MPKNKRKTAGKSRKPSSPSAWAQMVEAVGRISLDTVLFVIGLVLLAVALVMLVSMVSNFQTGAADQAGVESGTLENPANYAGILGAHLSYYMMNGLFGICSFLIPIFLIQLSMRLIGSLKVNVVKWFLHESVWMVWGSVALAALSQSIESLNSLFVFPLGGGHGLQIYDSLERNVGSVGCIALLIVTLILYLVVLSKRTKEFVRMTTNPTGYLKNNASEEVPPIPQSDATDKPKEKSWWKRLLSTSDEAEDDEPVDTADDAPAPQSPRADTVVMDFTPPHVEKAKPSKPAPPIDTPPEVSTVAPVPITFERPGDDKQAEKNTVGSPVDEQAPYDPRKDLENYRFPRLDLLKVYQDDGITINEQEQRANSERITQVLKNFDVEITRITATIGPTITLYEITPAPGVRISKIRNLENDIALSLSALGIRIIAPIPGKGTIGIEVPNNKPRIVSMESVLNSRTFEQSRYELPVALGKTITNEVFMVDLAKMPHLLVAGATGQGKSVGLNALITSLLYKKHPAELKLVMVDPKKVELNIYASLAKYFIATLPEQEDPIITDVSKVVQTLRSLCKLMDHRYDLLKKAKVRNIKEYNEKFKAHKLNPENGHAFMPYMVIVIDEFGDLIMTAGKEVELPIARIAQLARAVGMHMVIATQRPTTNIITGTIKANFPARMSFKVMSQIDSRTILDRTGANQLVGKGDMLFLSGMSGADPVRVQCAFVDTPEVERICQFIEDQPGYLEPYTLPEVEAEDSGIAAGGSQMNESLDSMFDEVARMIVVEQQGSTSSIQRKFSIGYNRAGRLMDQLCKAGIVGPAQGSKPRDVLITDLGQLDVLLAQLHSN